MGRAPTAAKATRKKNDRDLQKTAAACRMLGLVLRLSAGNPQSRAWDFAPAAPLTDGVGSVLDWEVDFPLAPVSTIGLRATSLKTTAPNPLLRSRSHAKKTFGEAFGAATVAGYAGPGFHTWPSGHIPQDNGSETASPHPAPCQKHVRRDVRRRDRGQRPTASASVSSQSVSLWQ